MRIQRPDGSTDRQLELATDIAEAVMVDGVRGRVCEETCTVICPSCGAAGCRCACSPQCAEAPRALSSDPENYPIEPLIVPLVYEMKRLGIFRPCWSCEGHLGPDGKLWKVPRVWFYCDSMVYVRLLADGLRDFTSSGRLNGNWQVVVSFSDVDNPETTFSLEPVLAAGEDHRLAPLQRDIGEIASSLHGMINHQARRLQREAGAVLDPTH